MKEKLHNIFLVFICMAVLTGCAGNTASENTLDGEEISVETADPAEAGSLDQKEDYKDIVDLLEKEDYDGAIAVINSMRPAPSQEIIDINMDNWSDYYSFEKEFNYSYDAQGNVTEEQLSIIFKLKPEYVERVRSLSGTIGYEYSYVPHRMFNINKEDGSFDTEILDDGPGYDDFSSRLESRSTNLNSQINIATGEVCRYVGTSNSRVEYSLDIDIEEMEEGDGRCLYYPEEINIVRIEGEIILNE